MGNPDDTALAAVSDQADATAMPDIPFISRIGNEPDIRGLAAIAEVKTKSGGTLGIYKTRDGREVVMVRNGITMLAFRHVDNIKLSLKEVCRADRIVFFRDEGKGFDADGKVVFIFQK